MSWSAWPTPLAATLVGFLVFIHAVARSILSSRLKKAEATLAGLRSAADLAALDTPSTPSR